MPDRLGRIKEISGLILFSKYFRTCGGHAGSGKMKLVQGFSDSQEGEETGCKSGGKEGLQCRQMLERCFIMAMSHGIVRGQN